MRCSPSTIQGVTERSTEARSAATHLHRAWTRGWGVRLYPCGAAGDDPGRDGAVHGLQVSDHPSARSSPAGGEGGRTSRRPLYLLGAGRARGKNSNGVDTRLLRFLIFLCLGKSSTIIADQCLMLPPAQPMHQPFPHLPCHPPAILLMHSPALLPPALLLLKPSPPPLPPNLPPPSCHLLTHTYLPWADSGAEGISESIITKCTLPRSKE